MLTGVRSAGERALQAPMPSALRPAVPSVMFDHAAASLSGPVKSLNHAPITPTLRMLFCAASHAQACRPADPRLGHCGHPGCGQRHHCRRDRSLCQLRGRSRSARGRRKRAGAGATRDDGVGHSGTRGLRADIRGTQRATVTENGTGTMRTVQVFDLSTTTDRTHPRRFLRVQVVAQ